MYYGIESGFIQDERLISSVRNVEDAEVENVLRPRRMSQYVGQKKIKDNLSVYISAAKAEENTLITCCFTDLRDWEKPRWHILLPPNLGHG